MVSFFDKKHVRDPAERSRLHSIEIKKEVKYYGQIYRV